MFPVRSWILQSNKVVGFLEGFWRESSLQQHVLCSPLLWWKSKHNHICTQMRTFSKQPLFSSFEFQRVVAERVSTVKHKRGPLDVNKHFDLNMTGLAGCCWWGLFVLNFIQNGFQHNMPISWKNQQPKQLNHNSRGVKCCYADWILRAVLRHEINKILFLHFLKRIWEKLAWETWCWMLVARVFKSLNYSTL